MDYNSEQENRDPSDAFDESFCMPSTSTHVANKRRQAKLSPPSVATSQAYRLYVENLEKAKKSMEMEKQKKKAEKQKKRESKKIGNVVSKNSEKTEENMILLKCFLHKMN